MEGINIDTLRDSSVISILDIFGISYFFLFCLQRLLFHFPISTEEIGPLLAILLFGTGNISWFILSLTRRILLVIGSNDSSSWEDLEFVGILILIHSTTVSYVALQFSARPSVQLGYICALSWFFVAHLADLLGRPASAPVTGVGFFHHCTSVVLFALGPVIHAVLESEDPGNLAAEVAWFAIYNGFGAAQYYLQPLERLGFLQGWQPSLYAMHLVLVFSAVQLSSHILPIAQ